jgi:hypothetical protein
MLVNDSQGLHFINVKSGKFYNGRAQELQNELGEGVWDV